MSFEMVGWLNRRGAGHGPSMAAEQAGLCRVTNSKPIKHVPAKKLGQTELVRLVTERM